MANPRHVQTTYYPAGRNPLPSRVSYSVTPLGALRAAVTSLAQGKAIRAEVRGFSRKIIVRLHRTPAGITLTYARGAFPHA